MVIIEKPGKRARYFAEIEDFPYANSLSTEVYEHLKSQLELKLENYYKQQKFIAMMMAQKDKKLAA